MQDDNGCVLVKDLRRPKQHDDYQGDERGRYSRTWLSRDKVQAVLRSSVGFTPGAVWRRRNALVLYTHMRQFRDVETWHKNERLFDYDLADTDSGIGVAGASALAAALTVNTSLEFLHLGENSIGDGGASALAEALKVNTSLKWLDLTDNGIGSSVVKIRKYARSGCFVVVSNNPGDGCCVIS